MLGMCIIISIVVEMTLGIFLIMRTYRVYFLQPSIRSLKRIHPVRIVVQTLTVLTDAVAAALASSEQLHSVVTSVWILMTANGI